MPRVHFLNVGKGDCSIIEHASGHVTMIDICKGNYQPSPKTAEQILIELLEAKVANSARGNFGMSKKPTNPIDYLQAIDVKSIFRFILTHPDMDHLDGLDALFKAVTVQNFWETGVRKDKPDFKESTEYNEIDWDRYADIYSGKQTGLTVLNHLAGSKFKYANRNEDGKGGGDGLHILAPDSSLVAAANNGGEVNDASYVLLYRSAGGKILIPGDAHDDTWSYVLEHYAEDIANCSVLFAPHHGRKSGADFSFLDTVRPRITFFGCASSGHLAYSEWSRRNLPVITNSQAGNIVLEIGSPGIGVYVENGKFAEASKCDTSVTNAQGYVYFGQIQNPEKVKV